MKAMEEKSCLHCGRNGLTLKGRGLCSLCWHYHRHAYPITRVMRPYSAREREYMCVHWRCIPAARIAATLGRDLEDVYSAAARFSCCRPPARIDQQKQSVRRLRSLHERGYSDGEIARAMGYRQTVISRVLRRLDLPANGAYGRRGVKHMERTCAILQAQVKHRISTQGAEAVCTFARRAARDRATVIRMGWPDADTLLQARALEALAAYPDGLTAAQLGSVLERSATRGGDIARALKRLGLVVVAGRINHWWVVYRLADGVQKSNHSRPDCL